MTCICSPRLLSSWLTVAIACERLVAVYLPFRAPLIATPHRARLLVLGMTAITAVLSTFAFWTMRPKQANICSPVLCVVDDMPGFQVWWTVVDRLGTLLIPGVILVACTVVIVGQLEYSRRLHAEVGTVCKLCRTAGRHPTVLPR
jgi:hypothetical protein